MSNKIMGGNAYRGDCSVCGKALFGTTIHHCPKSERAIELAKKRKLKRHPAVTNELSNKIKQGLIKQILKTTKDFGIEKPLEGWDKIYQEWFNLPYEIDYSDWLKENYSPPKLKKK